MALKMSLVLLSFVPCLALAISGCAKVRPVENGMTNPIAPLSEPINTNPFVIGPAQAPGELILVLVALGESGTRENLDLFVNHLSDPLLLERLAPNNEWHPDRFERILNSIAKLQPETANGTYLRIAVVANAARCDDCS